MQRGVSPTEHVFSSEHQDLSSTHLAKEAAEEGAEGSDTGTGGNHDVGGGRVLLGHEHNLYQDCQDF
jgi:hypothetical protein